ncbi:MAG: tRNA guanosine(34) transglycosylase Tgt [Planctomycetota bacterium]|jgi:queuine tRNA-ribosyltransferase
MSAITFAIEKSDATCNARVGRVMTPHGQFQTPAFMPVGTKATLKGILPPLIKATGAEVVLANTYHLMLRPGSDLIARRGGLHPFMGWPGPILTDSGGYQAFSMSDINELSDEGVRFKSIIDGSQISLTPERAVEVQHELGADIIMAFDDCPPGDESTPNYSHRLDEANERTVRWLERCREAHRGHEDRQGLFGIVQGGTDLEKRSWSVERICQLDLPGFAIGGVAVGEGTEQIRRVVEHTAPLMPQDKPRYLMGVGYERDIVMAVRAGVDMFDCVLPTRNGRNANAFTREGQKRLRNAQFSEDDGPIEQGCDCLACDPLAHAWDMPEGAGGRHFSRAYIRHLFLADEMLGPILVSLHNVRHFQRLMVDIREAIREDDWSALTRRWPVASSGLSASDGSASPGAALHGD